MAWLVFVLGFTDDPIAIEITILVGDISTGL
jgi:hypothetical protein